MGVLEEGAKAAGGVVDAMRGQPLAIANIVLNIAFLVFLFYYVSIIAERAKFAVAEMYAAQDKLSNQWTAVLKDTNDLTEKTMHCILPSDALMLLNARPSGIAPPPDRPAAPAPLAPRAQSLSPVFKKTPQLELPPLPPIPIEDIGNAVRGDP